MSQQQQEQQPQEAAPKQKSSSSSKFTVLVLIIAGCIVFWLGWGREMMQQAKSPSPTTQPVVAAVPPQPAVPAGPRPTVGAPPARPGALRFGVSGTNAFNFGGVYLFVIHYNQSWTGVDQQKAFTADPGYPKATGDTWEYNGKWSPTGTPFTWKQTIRQLPGNAAAYEVSVKSDQPVPTNALALGVNLPFELYGDQTVIIDGEPLKFPQQAATPATANIFGPRQVKRLELATPTGNLAIEGPVNVLIQDNRAYGSPVYYIRLGFVPESGMISDAALKLTFREIP